MFSRSLVAVTVAALAAGGASAVELVGVHGSSTRFTTTMEATAGDKLVRLVLTGAALRQKVFINVYAVASYVQEGVAVRTAERLAEVDCVKRLHLVMERDVDGKDMAAAFQTAIRANNPAPAFGAEVEQLTQMMQGNAAKKGDHIFLTHLPGAGLHVSMPGKADFTIRNPAFSRAVWDIYLGKNNLGEGIKRGLVSRVTQ
jgi:Chalcone isomerase-like